MTSSSHLASSALTYLVVVAVAEGKPSVEGLVVTAFGSLLPDIDTPTSSIGRPVFPVARWMDRFVGHRTFTHSVVGTVFFACLLFEGVRMVEWAKAFPVWMAGGDRTFSFGGQPLLPAWGWLLLLGYFSHGRCR